MPVPSTDVHDQYTFFIMQARAGRAVRVRSAAIGVKCYPLQVLQLFTG